MPIENVTTTSNKYYLKSIHESYMTTDNGLGGTSPVSSKGAKISGNIADVSRSSFASKFENYIER